MSRDWRWWGWQGALLLVLILVGWWLASRLAAYPFLSFDFSFLAAPAGNDAEFIFLRQPDEDTTFAALFALAWLDTALLGLAALVGATSFGLGLGRLARSSHPRVGGLAKGVTAVLRGLPMKLLLLGLATWSFYLPSLRETEGWAGFHLYSRAFHLPGLKAEAALWFTGGVALAGLSLGLWALQRWQGRRARLFIGGLMLLAPLLAFLATGQPLEILPPVLRGFSLVGGWEIPLPALAAWVALSLYGAGAIATACMGMTGRWWHVASPHWPRVILMLPIVGLAGLADFFAIASSAFSMAGRALEVLSLLLLGYLLLSLPFMLLARCLRVDTAAGGASSEQRRVWRSTLRVGLSVGIALLGLLLLWRAADWLILSSVVTGEEASLCRLAEGLETFDAEARGVDWKVLTDETGAAKDEAVSRAVTRLQRAESALATVVVRFDGLGPDVPGDLAEVATALDIRGLHTSLQDAIEVMDWPTVQALVLEAQPLVSWGDDHGGACWVVVAERWHFWLFGFAPDAALWHQGAACLLLLAAIGALARGRRPWLALLPTGGAISLLLLGPSNSFHEIGGLSLTLLLWALSSLVALGGAPLFAGAARSRLPLPRTLARLFGGMVRALPPLVLLAIALTLLQMLRVGGGALLSPLKVALVLGIVGAAYLAHPVGGDRASATGTARRFAVMAGLLRDTTLFVGGYDLLGAAMATASDAKWKGQAIELLLATAALYLLLHLALRWFMRPPAPGPGDDLYP